MQEKLTPQVAKQKIEKFCAWQERCQEEVRSKLYTYGLHMDDVESLIAGLIQQGFLNEERFAKAYCGGKFRQKQWGKNKIINGLKFKKVSPRNIQTGLLEISDEAYENTLQLLIEKQRVKHKKPGLAAWQQRQKTLQALMAKGFELELICALYDQKE
jgi:regulatory protein